MANKFYQADYPGGKLTVAPDSKLKGGAPFVGDPVANAMRAQDNVAALSRKPVLQLGNHGVQFWRFDTDLPGAEVPDIDEVQLIARTRVHVTQGVALGVHVLHSGSGNVNPSDGTTSGSIEVTAFWSSTGNATVEAQSLTLFCPNGPGQEPSTEDAPSLTVASLQRASGVLRINKNAATDRRDLDEELCQLDLEVRRTGSPRVSDLVIYEMPERVTKEDSDIGDDWTSHIFEDGGGPPRLYFPSTEASDIPGREDPRRGTEKILDVSRAQGRRLGGPIAMWTAYTEGQIRSSFIETGEIEGREITSVTPVLIGSFNMSAGANMLGVSVSHPIATGDSGAIPIRVRIFGRATDSNGEVLVRTSLHQEIIVQITSATKAWFEASGTLEVGSQPGQYPRLASMSASSASGTVSVLYAVIEREPNSTDW